MQSNTADQMEHKAKNPSNEKTAEKCASTRQAAKERGGELAAITHEACWLEREPVATPQAKYQEQTDQVQQV